MFWMVLRGRGRGGKMERWEKEDGGLHKLKEYIGTWLNTGAPFF